VFSYNILFAGGGPGSYSREHGGVRTHRFACASCPWSR
jgi:hypothetical protein